MTWNIVCDSSGDMLPAELIPGKVNLDVVSMKLLVGGREFVDDAALDVDELLQHMAAETSASSTACPSPEAFAQAFSKADCSLCFVISSNLSGTYSAACMGRDMALEEYPEKKIFVLNTCSTSGALYLLVQKTMELLKSGEEDFDTICHALQAYKDNLYTLFTLENFDNLVKNGRMRPLLGNLLHTLGIHVLAGATREGTICMVDKARGEKKAFRNIISAMQRDKDCTGADLVIAHCKNPDAAQRLKEAVLTALPLKSVTILPCRGLTTFYAMEKGLIMVY